MKICRWDGHRCFRSACACVDVSGSVVVCRRHRKPDGICMPKKAVPVYRSVFSKHLRVGRK